PTAMSANGYRVGRFPDGGMVPVARLLHADLSLFGHDCGALWHGAKARSRSSTSFVRSCDEGVRDYLLCTSGDRLRDRSCGPLSSPLSFGVSTWRRLDGWKVFGLRGRCFG